MYLVYEVKLFHSKTFTSKSIYKCSKEDPNNARNDETENWSMEVSMWRPFKVTVAGKPIAPIIIPESGYVNE